MRSQTWVFWRRVLWPQRHRWLGLMLSVALGVAGLVSVEGTLTETRDLLYREARDRLGADLTLSAWRPLNDPWSIRQRDRLHKLGDLAQVTELASMGQPITSSGAEPPRLIALKGVDAHYPLRGDLMISRLNTRGALLSPKVTRADSLSTQGIWITQSLWEQMSRPPQDRAHIKNPPESTSDLQTPSAAYALKVGQHTFTVEGVISSEPDAGFVGALSFAPRVMIRQEALDELGLTQTGSRVRHKLLFALTSSAERSARLQIRQLERSLHEDAPLHIRIQSFNNAQPDALQVFESVGLFFILVGLVALCLCLTSLISGAWSVVNDLLSSTAIARAMGIGPRVIRRAYTYLFLSLGIAGGALGLGIGWGIQRGLSVIAEPFIGAPLAHHISFPQSAWALSLGVGMSLLVNQLIQRGLGRLSAHELWSRHGEGVALSRLDLSVVAGLVLINIGLYVSVTSGSMTLGVMFALGLIVLTSLVAMMIALSLFVARRALSWTAAWRWPAGIRFALRQLLGYHQRTWVSLLTLGVSFSLIGGLLLVGESIEHALNPDADRPPQVFLIDVQDDQRTLVEEVFATQGLDAPDLRPLIRARITAIDGTRITQEMMRGARPAQQRRARSLRREYNLTTQVKLSPSERLSSGEWWSGEEALNPQTRQVSVERRHAQRMGLQIGDEITFDLQGREMSFRVSSLRAVNWLSFRPNFLYVLAPGPLQRAPKMWIGAATIPPAQGLPQLSAALFERAPNITLLDLRPVLAEGQKIIKVLITALHITGGVCVIAGLLLLMGNIRRERERRAQSVHLLSALGVSFTRAQRWVTLELMMLGLFAALTVLSGVLTCAWTMTQALNVPLASPYTTLMTWSIVCTLAPPIISRSSRGHQDPLSPHRIII